MFGLVKRNQDSLTKKVELKDVKYYLSQAYNNQEKKEREIQKLENEIVGLKETELKYNAMLVVAEKKEEHYQQQEVLVEKLRKQISVLQENVKDVVAKQTDIKINAENKLKEKDNIIKELKNEIKELSKKKGVKNK